ncbi:3-oxoadipate enol-lactonase [Beijerinckia mobilis]|uniref:3-oxoadipate enol-lactonase n=1 Tax=Beijerinckia mobilis TaxID=231434 RepID=UPI0009FD80E2|nr:3-oxoadipate enol-lactonase [Beijerinckia mobilis]
MTHILVDGRSFHVLLQGDAAAPVLMLAHPLGASLHIFDRLAEALSPFFRILRYDARGHGESSITPGPCSIADLGRDALGIMDGLGIERVHWLGQSMGGMVGQWLLANAPGRIDRAVLANTTARPGDPNLWNTRIAMVRAQSVAGIADAVFERWFTAEFRAAHAELIAPVRARFERTDREGYISCCTAIRDMDLHEAIRVVKQPVLVIVGNADPSTPPAEGHAIAESIASARLETLPAAHISHIEAEAAFTRAVTDFLTTSLETAHPKKEAAKATLIGRPNPRRLKPSRGLAKSTREADAEHPLAPQGKKAKEKESHAKEPKTVKAGKAKKKKAASEPIIRRFPPPPAILDKSLSRRIENAEPKPEGKKSKKNKNKEESGEA